jgi:hypothetical protein
MNIPFAKTYMAYATLVGLALLIASGASLLGLFLHLRTVLCGLLPVLAFLPFAWQTLDHFDSKQDLSSIEKMSYALFGSLAMGSALGFLLLTANIGFSSTYLGLSAFFILLFRRWWISTFPAEWHKSISFFRDSHSSSEKFFFLTAILLALCAAIVPPLGYDAHEYHLAVPEQYIQAGSWFPFYNNIYAGFPMNVEMLYLWPLSLHSAAGCTVINFLFALVVIFALVPLGKRWGLQQTPLLAPLLFLSTGFVLRLIIQANIDMALAASTAILLLAFERFIDKKKKVDIAMMAIALGFALGAKYIALLSILFPFLCMTALDWFFHKQERTHKAIFVAILLGACLFAPWLLRNMVLYQNPFYPLFASVLGGEPAFFTALFKAAHSAPNHSIVEAAQSFFVLPFKKSLVETFPAGFSCLWLFGFPLLLRQHKNHPAFRALLFMIAGYAAWFFLTQQNDRFLASVLPLFALTGAFVFAEKGLPSRRTVLHALLICIVGAQLWFASTFILSSDSVTYITLPTWEDNFLAQRLPHYKAIQWLNERAEENTESNPVVGNVLFIGEAQTYGAKFNAVAPTVFNRHPLEYRLPPNTTHIVYNRFELTRLHNGYGPLGWPLGTRLEAWLDQAKTSLLEPVFDAYPEQPGYLVVYKIRHP